MPARQDPTGAFLGTAVLLGSLLYLTFVSHPCWYRTVLLVLYRNISTVPYCWYWTVLLVKYRTVGTVPYCWYCTVILVLYRTVGTVPYCCYCTVLLVKYRNVGTVPYCWYSTVLLVQYRTVGTVPYCWYCTVLLVKYRNVGTVPYCWYCTVLLVLYRTVGTVQNHTLHCKPRPISHASLAFGLSAKCTGQITNTYDLCAKSIWPDHLTTQQTCVFCLILAVPLGCNFHRLELGARDWLTDTTIKLLCIRRSWTFDHQFIQQTPTHRSARTWDPTL